MLFCCLDSRRLLQKRANVGLEPIESKVLSRGLPKDPHKAAEIDGTWYHWQDGRLLPEGILSEANAFSPHRFYRYPSGRPRLPEVGDERAEQLRQWFRRTSENPPVRHMGFFDALYRIPSRAQAEEQTVPFDFLGFDVRVHRDLLAPLRRVERSIEYRSQENPKIELFFDSIGQIDGYNWRYIAGTRARSYHSYGAAIDLIPRRYGRRFPYWRWAADAGITDWWSIPFTRRWMVPYEIVEAFEQEGFIWGGKWLYFDTMHFEYRPELQLLSDR